MRLWFLLLTLNGAHPEPVKMFWEDYSLCVQSQVKWQQLGYGAECIELPQALPPKILGETRGANINLQRPIY
jgi:hypothetical protein